mgnify:CR=1 FL=1
MNATLLDAYNLFHEGQLVLAKMERRGIHVDVEYCRRKLEEVSAEMERLQREFEATKLHRYWSHVFGNKMNINSSYQLSYILYDKLKIQPVRLTAAGKGSVDEDSLSQLDVPGLDKLIECRKLTKVKSTYLEAFIAENVDGYLHPAFLLNTVRTYRSSCVSPNFQNIPKRDKRLMEICRRAIIPRPGRTLVEADFSSLEVRIAACYCKDPVLINYLTSESGDMHLDTARELFFLDDKADKSDPRIARLRQAAKNGFVFPQFYGDYYVNCTRNLCDWVELEVGAERWSSGSGAEIFPGVPIAKHLAVHKIRGYRDFEEHVRKVEHDFWNKRFQVYNRWRKHQVERYARTGKLRMKTGFECSGVMQNNEVINYPIQGSAFHCLLKTLIELDRFIEREGLSSFPIAQIHDSIVIDAVPEEVESIKDFLTDYVRNRLPKEWDWIIVPLDIEVTVFGVDKPWLE